MNPSEVSPAMTAEERVKELYPDARILLSIVNDKYFVTTKRGIKGVGGRLSEYCSFEKQAWESAASRLPASPVAEGESQMDKFVADLREWHVNNLQPCPFCGSRAAFGDDGDGGNFIECVNKQCGITTVLQYSLKEDCKPLLAERWNRRLG